MTATHLRRALPAALALAAAALTLYAYRELPGRPFAADDYQWLLNVRGLPWPDLAARAFDAGAQTHFFRPMVWLLFGAQSRGFGLEPAGWHWVSLALHLLCAALLALLLRRICAGQRADQRRPKGFLSEGLRPSDPPLARQLAPALAFAFVALHPAPFEAVVWVSAQSELLAAALLLLALHLWLPRADGLASIPRALAATLALGLALLAKESAVIGAALLLLLGPPLRHGPRALRLGLLALPVAAGAAYLALQQDILARNEIIRGAGYGLGPQLALNPLRTLGLVAAPLPDTQYGDAWWLPWAGAALAIALAIDLGVMAARRGSFALGYLRLLAALLLTLAPTAPFTSPPDSRYTYLPALAAAAIIGLRLAGRPTTNDQGRKTADRGPKAKGQPPEATSAASLGPWSLAPGPRAAAGSWSLVFRLSSLAVAVALAWWSAGELASREWRFSAASGPGGSLWRLASAECAAAQPSRIIVVEPPLAPPHAEAIVRLACGEATRPVVVGRDGIADARRDGSIVVAFPGGSAQVEER